MRLHLDGENAARIGHSVGNDFHFEHSPFVVGHLRHIFQTQQALGKGRKFAGLMGFALGRHYDLEMRAGQKVGHSFGADSGL